MKANKWAVIALAINAIIIVSLMFAVDSNKDNQVEGELKISEYLSEDGSYLVSSGIISISNSTLKGMSPDNILIEYVDVDGRSRSELVDISSSMFQEDKEFKSLFESAVRYSKLNVVYASVINILALMMSFTICWVIVSWRGGTKELY